MKMSTRRKIVLIAYISIIVFGAAPNIRILIDGTSIEPLTWLFDIPAYLFWWLTFPFDRIMILKWENCHFAVRTFLSAVYLAVLFWPMPLYALNPKKFSQPRTRTILKWYFVFLCVMGFIVFLWIIVCFWAFIRM